MPALPRAVRTALATLLGAALLILLSGCYLSELDATVSEDNTISGTLVLGVERAGTSLTDGEELTPGDFEFFTSSLERTDSWSAYEVKVESFRDATYVGERSVIQNAPLEVFNEGVRALLASGSDESSQEANRLDITRDGDEFVVDGFLDASRATDINQDLLGLVATGRPHITLTLTFPGEVATTSPDAVARGNTLIWTPRADRPSVLSARAAAAPDAGTGEGTSPESNGAGVGPLFSLLGWAVALLGFASTGAYAALWALRRVRPSLAEALASRLPLDVAAIPGLAVVERAPNVADPALDDEAAAAQPALPSGPPPPLEPQAPREPGNAGRTYVLLDAEQPVPAPAPAGAPISEDGKWWWDGTIWIPLMVQENAPAVTIWTAPPS